jgi:hypothetical protein
MVWFQVNIPLVVGCLLMAALLDLRRFKVGLLVSSVLLIFLGVGMTVFGAGLGIIPAHAIDVMSVMVWLGCVITVIPRWFRSKLPCGLFGSEADRKGTYETALSSSAWTLHPATGELTGTLSGLLVQEASIRELPVTATSASYAEVSACSSVQNL